MLTIIFWLKKTIQEWVQPSQSPLFLQWNPWLVMFITLWCLWYPIRDIWIYWRMRQRKLSKPQLALVSKVQRIETSTTPTTPTAAATTTKTPMTWNQALIAALTAFVTSLAHWTWQFGKTMMECLLSLSKHLSTQNPPTFKATNTATNAAATISSECSPPSSTPKVTIGGVRREGIPACSERAIPSAETNPKRTDNTPIMFTAPFHDIAYFEAIRPHVNMRQGSIKPPVDHDKRLSQSTQVSTNYSTTAQSPNWNKSVSSSLNTSSKRQTTANHTKEIVRASNPVVNRRKDVHRRNGLVPKRIRPIVQTPLSEQMRKRRLEDDGKHCFFGQTPSKRAKVGRPMLGSGRLRIPAAKATTGPINKRQRLEREERILKDLNTKRVKKGTELAVQNKPKLALPDTDTNNPSLQIGLNGVSNTESKQGETKPSFQFGSNSTSATNPVAAGTSTDNETGKPKFQFGSAAPSGTSADISAPTADSVSNATQPTFQFGSAPVTSNASTEPPANSNTTKPTFPNPSSSANSSTTKPTFQFGSTSAPNPPAPSTEPAAVSSTTKPAFQFGSTPSNNPSANSTEPSTGPSATTPAFQFGTTQTPTTGTSAAKSTFQFGTASSTTSQQGPSFQAGSNSGFNTPLSVSSSAPAFTNPQVTNGTAHYQAAAAPPRGGFAVNVTGAGGASARRRAKVRSGSRR